MAQNRRRLVDDGIGVHQARVGEADPAIVVGDRGQPFGGHQFFAGSPQSLAADYILEGATGASGHVDEPYLSMTPRPDLLLPAYYRGRNLAESYYLAIPALSWQNIVLGDPLCSLGKP